MTPWILPDGRLATFGELDPRLQAILLIQAAAYELAANLAEEERLTVANHLREIARRVEAGNALFHLEPAGSA
jgi:hypothetical protein